MASPTRVRKPMQSRCCQQRGLCKKQLWEQWTCSSFSWSKLGNVPLKTGGHCTAVKMQSWNWLKKAAQKLCSPKCWMGASEFHCWTARLRQHFFQPKSTLLSWSQSEKAVYFGCQNQSLVLCRQGRAKLQWQLRDLNPSAKIFRSLAICQKEQHMFCASIGAAEWHFWSHSLA